jgi:hypothetical protein
MEPFSLLLSVYFCRCLKTLVFGLIFDFTVLSLSVDLNVLKTQIWAVFGKGNDKNIL